MNLLGHPSLWQRHHAIECSMARYHDLSLRFPAAARRAKSGEIHARISCEKNSNENNDQDLAFRSLFNFVPLSPEAEAENEEWRNLIMSIVSLSGQIFHSSRDPSGNNRDQSEDLIALRHHGDMAIGKIVSDNWRSLKSNFVQHAPVVPELVNMINSLVQQCAAAEADFEQIMAQGSEGAHA